MIEMPGIERHSAKADLRTFTSQPVREWGKEDDHTDIGEQELELTINVTSIEPRRGNTKTVGGHEQIAEAPRNLKRPRGRAHRIAMANKRGSPKYPRSRARTLLIEGWVVLSTSAEGYAPARRR